MILLFLGVFTFSSRLDSKIVVHLHGGAVFPTEDNIADTFSTGFGFSYYLLNSLAFNLDFISWKSDVDEITGHLYEGKMTSNLFLISGQYFFSPDKKINPYAFLGTGIIFNDFKIGEYYSIPEITLSQKVEGGLLLNLGAGALFKITDSLSIFFDLFYLVKSASGTTVITDMNFGSETSTFAVKLNTAVVRLGLRYWLN